MDTTDISFNRVTVPLSFVINVACQIYYGFFASPSMKQIAETHYSAFSPSPYFIVVFFVFQFIVQLLFIRGLFNVTATPKEPTLSERFFRYTCLIPASAEPAPVEPVQSFYSSALTLGNLLHVVWTVLWMQKWFWTALPVVVFNTFMQSFIGFLMLEAFSPTDNEVVAFFISKVAAGVGCLGILDTIATAAGYVGPPSPPVQVIIVFLFCALCALREGTMIWNIALLFDVLALGAGQPTWSATLGVAAVFMVLEIFIFYFAPCDFDHDTCV